MSNKGAANLGKFFADIVCSKHNQNVMIRFVAIAGMGKSWAAQRLAQQISYYIAKKRGGTEDDYYNPKEDLAVISLDRVTHVMEHAKKYHVIVLDDVTAKAMNARNFATTSNKDLNAIVQTWRPNHNALITTQQASFLVDKVWKNLFNYQIEIIESHFDKGFVIAKVKRISYQHDKDKTYYPYIQEGNIRYVRCVITAPPKKWQQMYEEERAYQLKKIRELEQRKEAPQEQPKTIKERCQELQRDIEAGIYEGMTTKKICRMAGIKYGTYRNNKL